MALSDDQQTTIAELLQEHPDWTSSEIRAAAGLPVSALFAVKAQRRRLGVPEPERAPGAEPKRRRAGSSKRQASSIESDTLDDAGEPIEPSGPKRSGSKRPQSLLAPVLPRLAQLIAHSSINVTHNATRGLAGMSRQEATAIAVPAVRILDRNVAKYIRKSGKVTPDQEDFALILLTVVVWGIAAITAAITHKPRAGYTAGAGAAAGAAPGAEPGDSPLDLFAGSEPSMPSPRVASLPVTDPGMVSASREPATAASAAAGADAGDLFAGSEPAAPGRAGGAGGGAGRAGGGAGGGAVSVPEHVLQSIMPTDLGEALAG